MTTALDAVATAIREEAKNFGALAHKADGENAIEYRLARAAVEAWERVVADALKLENNGCGEYGCSPYRIMDLIAELTGSKTAEALKAELDV